VARAPPVTPASCGADSAIAPPIPDIDRDGCLLRAVLCRIERPLATDAPARAILHFTLAPDDTLALAQYRMFSSPGGRRSTRLFRLFVFAFIAATTYSMAQPGASAAARSLPPVVSVGMALLMGAIAYWLVSPRLLMGRFVSRIARRQAENAHGPPLGEQTVDAGHDGLTWSTARGEARYPWESLERVATQDDRTFLFVGGATAIVVPHASIVDGDLPLFLDAVRYYFTPR